MNFRSLQVFATVASSKGITDAAERLMISQPAVSMQIKRLEDELGVALFTQSGRGVLLTDAGKTLKEYAEKILALEEQCLRAMSEYKEGQRGRIVIGAPPVIETFLLPHRIAAFREDHREIELVVQQHTEHEIETLVRDGHVDVGIMMGQPSDHFAFRITKYGADRWIAIEASSSASSPFIYLTRETPQEIIESLEKAAGLTLVFTQSAEAAVQSVLAGLGSGVVLQSAVQLPMQTGLIRETTIGDLPAPAFFTMITRPAERLAKSAWLFLEHAKYSSS